MLGIRLGFRSLWHDRAILLFSVVALSAVLGPLLVLWGLKNGVVGSLLDGLKSNPATLEVRVRGHAAIKESDYRKIEALPGVGFIVPDISSIAADVMFEAPGSRGLQAGQAWPTAPGDPLLPRDSQTPAAGQATLSATMAQVLAVKAKDNIVLVRQRIIDGRAQILRLDLEVVSVMDASGVPGRHALLAVSDIQKIQTFVDGYEVLSAGLPGRPIAERPQVYERLRLYAADIERIEALAAAVTALGFDVTSKAAEVGAIFSLDRNLKRVFILLAAIGGVGYVLSLWAGLSGSLARKRREISLFRLMGAGAYQLSLFVFSQGAAIATAGVVLAFAVFATVAAIVNAMFAASLPGRAPCFLLEADVITAGAGTFAIVLLVSWFVARPVAAISPSEVLHDY